MCKTSNFEQPILKVFDIHFYKRKNRKKMFVSIFLFDKTNKSAMK